MSGFSRSDLNGIVMNYLVTEGYKEAAERFSREANIATETLETRELVDRMRIRQAIQNGCVKEAISLLDIHFPGILLSNFELKFQLELQQFVELIRQRECEAALEFAQMTLAAALQVDNANSHQIRNQLERAMALLAFDDPSQSPFCDLLLDSQRHKLASAVNETILQSMQQSSSPNLATFYKLLMWMQHELDQRKVKYDRMVDFVSASTEAAAK